MAILKVINSAIEELIAIKYKFLNISSKIFLKKIGTL
jgi:hypothetical protein